MNERTARAATTFEHVGPKVEYGDVVISNEEADQFRQTALKGAKLTGLHIDDDDTRTIIQLTSYADGILSDAIGDYEVYSMSLVSKTILQANPDSWRSVISFARFNAKHRDTKIYNIYEVEGIMGEVTLAVRRVRVIRNLSRIAFDDNGDPFEDIYDRQRKAFETPLLSEDIEAIDARVERTTSRSLITGGH